ncbi:hypothetical protein GCM10011391_14110 [Pullulanibacillus camelliae]|uniref:Phage shock protein PspC N-terminal domain-containing protein n=1 Tax=Pullulanibacillus camelliae TaxID=1707096 RepID=A0A8J2VQ45_9BACL|nr:PspC domain-containing protein [Pullulanibacillus camelliae]GGE36490.1 hypothetical protein GCM10011391_14110 [Pullulanibacillus camelliae]
MKRLYRSRKNRMLAGILGGIAEMLNIDATIIRVIYVVLLVISAFFPLVLLYFILYFIIPGEDNY